ncbi:MAG: DUF3786 domain-containing protein [Desulfobacteraceae bacterium]|nr:DUF3786 domain-containing protein [Desulfobacteraceae bacterium]
MLIGIDQEYQEARSALADMDWAALSRRIGCQPMDNGLALPFFQQIHQVSPDGCVGPDSQPATAAVGLVLCRYVLRFPPQPLPQGPRITFRELTDSGPLVARFADNTLKIITTTFGRRGEDLLAAAIRLGGRREANGAFDLFLRFEALPHVPLFLQFNAADDLFPAQAALLFHCSAETYLDLRSLFILGTYLTGRLITA